MRARLFVVPVLLVSAALHAQTAPLAANLAPTPSAKYAPGRVLVRFRSGRSQAARSAAHLAAGAVSTTRVQHVPSLELVRLSDPQGVQQALASYRRNPDVLYAEPDYIIHADVTAPNDPFFTLLWGMNNTGQQNGTPGADIGALQAWGLSTGSNNVVVGILDTGINPTHPDLIANLLGGTFFVDGEITDFIGHGTHVAGTIGASGNNGIGVAGVNWNISMEPCKFINFDGGATSNAILCLDFIAGLKGQGMNVIATNNSWGGTEFSFALRDAIRAQMDSGILFIAAAGNNAEDNDIHPHFPASYDVPNIISVAATDRDDRLATFSNFGARSVHLGAPGVNVVSTFGTDYESLSGTSMATPHVTGTAALAKAYQPGLDWRAIKNRILAGGNAVASLSGVTITGNRLNAFDALTCANRPVMSRVEPRNDIVTTVSGAHVSVEMLNINCDQPAGNVTVTVQPGGQTLTLLDDGVGPDQAAGDGIYSADFIAPDSGTFTLHFPNGDQAQVRVLRAYSFQSVPFAYRSISGTDLALSDDQSKAIDLPFPVHIGGNTFSRLFVNSNGYVTLDFAYNSANVLPMPFPTTGSIIAPWWDDWNPSFDSPNNVYWAVNGTAPSREIVIEWRKLPYFVQVGPPGDGVTFQLVFFEDRDDVLFNYLNVNIANTFVDVSGGGSASVGIQIGPTAGTQFSFIPFFLNPADPTPLKNQMSLLWQLAPVDVSLKVNPISMQAYPGTAVTFPTVVTSLFGFTSTVTVDCSGSFPATCVGNTVTPSPFGTLVNVQAGDTVPGTYSFAIRAQNTLLAVTHQQPVTLNLVDYQLSAPTPGQLSIPNNGKGSISFQVTAAGPFASRVSLGCSGVPGAQCVFSPSPTVSPTANTPVNVIVTVIVPPKSTPGAYTLQISGMADGVQRTVNVPLTITSNVDFLLLPAATDVGADATQPSLVNVIVDQQDGYAGTVQLSCSVVPAGPQCGIAPTSVGVFPQQVVLSITAGNAPVGAYQVTISGNDGARTHSVVVNYRIGVYSITGPGPIVTFGGVSDTRIFTVGWSGTPNVQLAFQCIVPAPANCFLPGAPLSTATAPNPSQVQALLFVRGPLPSFPLTFIVLENGIPVRSLTVPVTASGFTLTAGPNTVQTVAVGQVSAPFDLTLNPWGGYSLPTTVTICGLGCQTKTVTPAGQTMPLPFTLAPPIDSRFPFSDIVFNALAQATSPVGVITQATDPNAYRVHIQDAWLQPSTDQIAIVPGKSVAFSITARASNGLVVPMQLSCPTDLGLGLSCAFGNTTLNPGESTLVTITSTTATPPGFRPLFITGNTTIAGTAITRVAHVGADIGAFSFELRAATLTVPQGGEAFFVVDGNINLGTTEFFPATVTCDTPDAGVTCEPPFHASIPGAFGLPVRTSAGVTTVGPHSVNITVNVAGETHVLTATVVMQGADSIILTSPNGNENWPGGPRQIEWQFSGNPGSTVRLELLKNDTLDSIIADSVPIGADGRGAFTWTIPTDSLFSQFAKVRIVSDSRPDISDTSDSRFWTGHGAELLTPHGGDVIPNIPGVLIVFYTWTGLGAGSFELYKAGQLIATFPSQGNGYFDGPGYMWAETLFLPPNLTDGSDYTLRIIPGTDVTRASFNPGGPFSILTQNLVVTSPVKDQVFQPGDQVPIRWTYQNLTNSDVELTLSGDPTNPLGTVISHSVPLGANGSGSFTWTIPQNQAPGRNYSISVQDFAQPFGSVSQPFTIGTFHKLSVVITGLGLVKSTDPLGTVFCQASCDEFLVHGTTLTLTQVSQPGWKFSGWSGACSGTADCTLTFTADISFNALFVSTAPDFTFTTDGPSATVTSGSPATYTFTLASLNGFAGAVNFDCSNLPLNAKCSFTQNNVVPTATPTTVTVTLSTNGTASSSSVVPSSAVRGMKAPASLVALGVVPLLGLLCLVRKQRRALASAALLLLLAGILSCGGGGSSNGPPPPSTNTPPGTYTVSINATSATIRHSTPVTLVVK